MRPGQVFRVRPALCEIFSHRTTAHQTEAFRWLCERILAEDDRIKSMLYLPLNAPEECARTVETFAGKTTALDATQASVAIGSIVPRPSVPQVDTWQPLQ